MYDICVDITKRFFLTDDRYDRRNDLDKKIDGGVCFLLSIDPIFLCNFLSE